MTTRSPATPRAPAPVELAADVVVVGGGLAGTWTALGAAGAGASVVLVEKGYVGTSGVTATAGVGHWWVPPDPEARAAALADRQARAFGLGAQDWMERILNQTWELLPTIGGAFRFPTDDDGVTRYRTVRGPEYLRAMRRLVKRAGVRILDHSPALELLVGPDGAVAGVAGVRRQEGGVGYRVRAGAVVLSTGGCAFASHLLGSRNNTGDGLLMAAEAGAELSGMEFSNYYTLAPAWSTMTRSMSYLFGTYFDADGHELRLPPSLARNDVIARELARGPVFTRLDQTPEWIRRVMPVVQPNFMLPFDRKGIDPYTDVFEVALRCEGTVRGTGGLRIADAECSTTVPGLFAAGDVATRELVAGATSGGGAQNSAWALSSGTWAGRAAAGHARGRALARGSGAGSGAAGSDAGVGAGAGRVVVGIGGAGLRPTGDARPVDTHAAIELVRAHLHPIDRNLFRTGAGLRESLDALEPAWREVRAHLRGEGADVVRARETAAMLAAARWAYTAASVRSESRGMHKRDDRPASDDRFAHRLLVGGLDEVWTRPDGAAPAVDPAAIVRVDGARAGAGGRGGAGGRAGSRGVYERLRGDGDEEIAS